MSRSPAIAVFNDTSPTGHYGCYSVMRTIDRELRAHGMEPRLYWPVSTPWQAHASEISTEGIDLVLVNGEGTLHDTQGRRHPLNLTALGPFARQVLGVPAVLINATLFNLDPEAVTDLRSFSRIYTRDAASCAHARSLGLDASVVPDLSFFSSPEEDTTTHLPGQEHRGPLITDSVNPSIAAQLKRIAREHQVRYLPMMHKRTATRRSAVERLALRLGRLLRPRRVSTQSIHSSTYSPARSITSSMTHATFVNELRSASLLVSGRFHGVTLALREKVPVVGLQSNTPKVEYLLNDVFGSYRRQIDLRDIPSLLRTTPAHLFGFDDIEQERLDSYMHSGEALMHAMFEDVRAVALGRVT